MKPDWDEFVGVLGETEQSSKFISLIAKIGEEPSISTTPEEYNDPLGKTKYYKLTSFGLEIGFRQERLSHIHFFLKPEDGYKAYFGLLMPEITAVSLEAAVVKALGIPSSLGGDKQSSLLGHMNKWIKYDKGWYSIRFEFSPDSLMRKISLIFSAVN